MARIRTIKPEFWDDEKMSQLPRDVRLLYVGMWTFSDDFGVIKASPIWLKSKVFPFDEIQISQFKKWLEVLERPGFNSPSNSVPWVIPFMANGEGFYYLSKFSRHQKIERPSIHNRNPLPPEYVINWDASTKDHRILTEPSPSPHRVLTEPSPSTHQPLTAVLGYGFGIGDGNGIGHVISAAPASGGRERNLIWDSLIEIFGLSPVTKTELGRVGKLASELKLKKATPEEMRTRSSRYRQRWPSMSFTPEALCKHWDSLAQEEAKGINGATVNKSEIAETMRKVLTEERTIQ